DGSFAERIRDDFELAALLDEETLEQMRGSNRPSMRHREAQMGDAGFEVIDEAGNRAIVLAAIVGNDPGRELARNGSARRLIGRLRAYLELRPDVFRHLGRPIAHAMPPATPASRPRKANFDRLDDARSAIRGHQ